MAYTARQPVKSAHSAADFGFTEVEFKDAKTKYRVHRTHAKHRGLQMKFSFDEWMWFWLESGHWYERGTGRGQYVMSRYNDIGDYEQGNVFIQTSAANCKEALVKLDYAAIQKRAAENKRIGREKYLSRLKDMGIHPYAAKPCSVDGGITIYPSRKALIAALGTGRGGSKSKNLTYHPPGSFNVKETA